MEKLEFLSELSNKGVSFLVNIPNQSGSITIALSAEDTLKYYVNRDAFIASYHGVELQEYLLWLEEEYSVRCGANTKSGKQCKNTAIGGSVVDPIVWVKMQGEYCAVHGG